VINRRHNTGVCKHCDKFGAFEKCARCDTLRMCNVCGGCNHCTACIKYHYIATCRLLF
jgi:hypothetical protein